jgi:hypothetical protein
MDLGTRDKENPALGAVIQLSGEKGLGSCYGYFGLARAEALDFVLILVVFRQLCLRAQSDTETIRFETAGNVYAQRTLQNMANQVVCVFASARFLSF